MPPTMPVWSLEQHKAESNSEHMLPLEALYLSRHSPLSTRVSQRWPPCTNMVGATLAFALLLAITLQAPAPEDHHPIVLFCRKRKLP